MTFDQFNLHHSIFNAVTEDGYKTATPIQEAAIPEILKGRDLLGCAQTGTGKTAAFALPIIHHIQQRPNQGKNRKIQALILAPTRELALQIKESFDTYSRKNQVKAIAVYGGMSKRNQIMKIKRGVDVLIATPGRLLDLMRMKIIQLDDVKYYVLDEADLMLDMGFIDDVKTITQAVPKQRQTMLFSATMPTSIERLAAAILNAPIRLELTPQNKPLTTVTQSVFLVNKQDKFKLLIDTLNQDTLSSALVFVRTKRFCDTVGKKLADAGINAGVLHGDKTQSQRQTVLQQFKSKQLKILIATDVAARGIDIDTLSHVINMDMPETPQTYLHRIGRTARAGESGFAYSFCGQEERHLLKAIQRHIGFTLTVASVPSYIVSQTDTKRKNSAPKARASAGSIRQPFNKPKKKKTTEKQRYQAKKKKSAFYTKSPKYNRKAKRYAT